MRRRQFIPLALCLSLARLAWAQPASDEPADDAAPALPHYKVSTAALQAAVATRFPLRYEAADRTVRAHKLRLVRLQFPTPTRPGAARWAGYATRQHYRDKRWADDWICA